MMLQLFGIPIGTLFQGGTMVALIALVAGGITVFIKGIPARVRANTEREANLLSERAKEMQEMRERIERLEAAGLKKAEAHQEEIRRMAESQETKDRLYKAQKAADRHRINNLNQAFQGLLMLLKKGVPVEEAVQEIEKMRNEQLAREAAESAAISAAAIKAGLAEPEQ